MRPGKLLGVCLTRRLSDFKDLHLALQLWLFVVSIMTQVAVLKLQLKKRTLRWYGHISRSSGLAKTLLQGTVKGARRKGKQKTRWEDKEWTVMGFGDSLRAVEDRGGWKCIVAMSSVVPRRPPRLRDWDEMRWSGLNGPSLNMLCKYHNSNQHSV